MYSACYGRPGKHSSRPRGRQTLAGERGKEGETEDRGRGVGIQIFPALLSQRGEDRGKSIHVPLAPTPTSPSPVPVSTAAVLCGEPDSVPVF